MKTKQNFSPQYQILYTIGSPTPFYITTEDNKYMGCDIHLYVDKYNEKNKNWETIENWVGNDVPWINQIYQGRNYELFTILAGVRNTHSGLLPIKPAIHDIPANAAGEIKACYNSWSSDAHTATYYTLKEFQEFDWDKVAISTRGYISPHAYKLLIDGNERPTWNYTAEPRTGSKVVSVEELRDLAKSENLAIYDIFKAGGASRGHDLVAKVHWDARYRDFAGDFMYVIAIMEDEAPANNPEHIRAIMWFDN